MRGPSFVWVSFAAVIALLLAVASASGVSAQSATDDPGQVEAGKMVFETSCAGCHGEDGMGSNFGRPLTDVASEQPDRSVHIMSVTDGRGSMPAFGDQLSGEEIDAAISYVRLTFVSDEASAEDDELPVTGSETPLVAIGGATLVAAGLLLTHHGSRLRRRTP